jgi:hypothetical protein
MLDVKAEGQLAECQHFQGVIRGITHEVKSAFVLKLRTKHHLILWFANQKMAMNLEVHWASRSLSPCLFSSSHATCNLKILHPMISSICLPASLHPPRPQLRRKATEDNGDDAMMEE